MLLQYRASAFRNTLMDQSLSPNTIDSYCYDMSLLHKFLKKEDPQYSFKTLSSKVLVKFLNTSKTHQTQSRRIAAITAYLKSINAEELMESLGFKKTKTAKSVADEKDPQETFLTLSQVNRIIEAFVHDGSLYPRNRALLEILYKGMLTVSEALNLRLEDVDFKGNVVHVTSEGHQRSIPIGKDSAPIYETYLKTREQLVTDWDNPYFFISKKGGCLNRKSIWRILSKAAKRARVTLPDSSKSAFRNSCVAHMMKEFKIDIFVLQKLLGHVDIATTRRLVAKIEKIKHTL